MAATLRSIIEKNATYFAGSRALSPAEFAAETGLDLLAGEELITAPAASLPVLVTTARLVAVLPGGTFAGFWCDVEEPELPKRKVVREQGQTKAEFVPQITVPFGPGARLVLEMPGRYVGVLFGLATVASWVHGRRASRHESFTEAGILHAPGCPLRTP